MKRAGGWKWAVGALALLLVFSVGCAKKEMVKSTDTGAGAATAPPPDTMTAPPPVTSETVERPETQTAMREAEAGVAATQEQMSRFDDIHFDYDKSFIREDAKPVLEKVGDHLKDNPSATLVIEGHCDERGTPEYNLALGERRAISAKDYLVSLGVPSSAITTVSFGEEKPADPGHGEEAWAKNRRAHFVLK